MADNMTYLVTGANKGIGKQLVADLLLRPATTVVATVRDPLHHTSQSLAGLAAADRSRLVVLPLDAEAPSIGYESVQERLAAEGIHHVDVVVANAGCSAGFDGVLDTEPEAARRCFEVNSVGPLKLFRACWPLLQKSEPASPGRKKFVLITTSISSIEGLETESFPTTAYGMSKVSANWLARKMAVEFRDRGLKVGIIHPGWVRTDLGQSLADAVGVKEPPMTVADSSRQVIEQMDKLSFDTTHGKFVSFDGQRLPW